MPRNWLNEWIFQSKLLGRVSLLLKVILGSQYWQSFEKGNGLWNCITATCEMQVIQKVKQRQFQNNLKSTCS